MAMSESINGMKRTHMCGVPTEADLGKHVVMMGWVQKRRDLGGLIFVDLRDRSGLMQVVFDAQACAPEIFAKAERLRTEYVIAVAGPIVARDDETINSELPTGTIEVKADELRILSEAKTPPFFVDDEQVADNLRLKYRYIDLRRPEMQRNLMMKHKVTGWVRQFLDGEGFVDIETPMLTKSTPEGARDYLVPSRLRPGTFYALPQSPQILKQILMVAGFDRYYQITRCFRDEDLRANRQPEFTQIDMEMSFVTEEDVMELNERLIAFVFDRALGIKLERPFPRITWREAMDRYGSDKPDARFGMELCDVSDIVGKSDFKVFADVVNKGGTVRAINAKGGNNVLPRREIDSLVDVVKTYHAKGLAWIQVDEDGLKSPIIKFMSEEQVQAILTRLGAEPGDLLLFVADTEAIALTALGQLRLHMGRRLGLIDESAYHFLWVTDFPLVEYDEEEKRYVALHHPFTSPKDEDMDLLDTDPGKVRAKAYDLVVNGEELGGGSIRIHDVNVQERVFTALGFDKEKMWKQFGFMLEAFQYGAPPHGGIAYGLDRLLMLLLGVNSIRDVIAFPKVQNASCPLTQAPSPVDDTQLEELHIEITEEE
jgi:aspartyl-tRNA synthetase